MRTHGHRHKYGSAWGLTHPIVSDCWCCPYCSCEAWGRHRISINLAHILQAPLTAPVQHKQVCMPNWASLLPRLMSCLLIYIVRTFTLLSVNLKLFTAFTFFEPVQSEPYAGEKLPLSFYSCLVRGFKSKPFNKNFGASCLFLFFSGTVFAIKFDSWFQFSLLCHQCYFDMTLKKFRKGSLRSPLSVQQRRHTQFCRNPETCIRNRDPCWHIIWTIQLQMDGGSQVASPQSGVLTIPTLPCGLWYHTGLCLWMAMCSSPLISNRWWETSKWWSFTKTSSQNKVKGTQKNTKWSHEKKDDTFLIAAGCVAGSVKLYCVLFCFVENFNFLNLHYHGAKTDCISVHKGCKEMFSAQ